VCGDVISDVREFIQSDAYIRNLRVRRREKERLRRMVRCEKGSRNRRTDLAAKRMSSSSRSRSARAVLSDRDGLYMLKKFSGTRNEKACASIARAMVIQGCAARRKQEKV
jgi:hypothetical protein